MDLYLAKIGKTRKRYPHFQGTQREFCHKHCFRVLDRDNNNHCVGLVHRSNRQLIAIPIHSYNPANAMYWGVMLIPRHALRPNSPAYGASSFWSENFRVNFQAPLPETVLSEYVDFRRRLTGEIPVAIQMRHAAGVQNANVFQGLISTTTTTNITPPGWMRFPREIG